MLYTLGENERIVSFEHFVEFYADGYRYAMVTEDSDTRHLTLIFNGKRIPYGRVIKSLNETGYVLSMPDNDANYNYLCYIDVNEPDGYMIKCKTKSESPYGTEIYEYWVNRGGTMEGPYEYVWCDEEIDDKPKSKTYHYVLANRVYDNVDGRIRRSEGIFEMPYYYAKEVRGEGYDNGDNYIVENGKELYFNGEVVESGAELIRDVRLNRKGDYAYICRKGGKRHIVKNGYRFDNDVYTYLDDLYLAENGELAYIYDNKIHIPGVEVDTEYECVENFIYLAGGEYAFVYSDDDGPFSRNWYVKTAKTQFGPYSVAPLRISVAANGDCNYWVDSYRYCNGVKLDGAVGGCSLDVAGHNFYFNYEYDYVIIDGRRFGQAVPFEYSYDQDRNAFVWYCMEGRSLVVYEYALD